MVTTQDDGTGVGTSLWPRSQVLGEPETPCGERREAPVAALWRPRSGRAAGPGQRPHPRLRAEGTFRSSPAGAERGRGGDDGLRSEQEPQTLQSRSPAGSPPARGRAQGAAAASEQSPLARRLVGLRAGGRAPGTGAGQPRCELTRGWRHPFSAAVSQRGQPPSPGTSVFAGEAGHGGKGQWPAGGRRRRGQ